MNRVDGYAPIRDYAAIGDGRLVALVARDGSIDWLCLPTLDSPSVFGGLLDAKRGGRFALEPVEPYTSVRRYLTDTNVLETTFHTERGTVRVTDALTAQQGHVLAWRELARRIEGLSGEVAMRWHADLRFGYGLGHARREKRGRAVVFTEGRTSAALLAWGTGGNDPVRGDLVAREGSRALLAMIGVHDEPVPLPERDEIERRLDDTCDFWRRSMSPCTYDGRWAEAVRRSVLALKLLTSPRGGIAAAATTSLPEVIGGDSNWDYRYCWVRDASYTLDAILRLNLREQAHRSFAWLLRASVTGAPDLRVLYGLDGEAAGAEEELPLAGYRDSRPARIGNAAGDQLQLGIYGDFVDTAALYVREGNVIDDRTANRIAGAADKVCEIWEQKDAGIWETRDEQRHFTQSKISCWVALDRALALAEGGHIPGDRAERWRREAERVKEYIERECWSESRGSYIAYAGGDDLDASVLLAARVGYASGTSERLASTVGVLRAELGAGALLYRTTGAAKHGGAFLACSFWLVDALARLGRLEEASSVMDDLVSLANDVGLYAEEIDPETGAFLGNFPQGLTHLALILAACSVREAERG